MKYTSSTVIITGAAQGIGKAVAEGYAAEGATVFLSDVQEAEGAATAARIREQGGQAHFLPCDVRSEADVQAFIQEVVKTTGQIDVLINNAGISRWKSPYELTVDEWDEVMNTNVRACFLMSREAAKVMRDHEGGAIVNISSTRAHMSEPNSEAYAASKGGITALTHALAVSLGPDHIRVNSISPGWIENGDYSALKPEDHTQHPAQRVGKPDDIARACLFLTSKDNSFITGAELVIDGGMTRKMIYIE
ncbi:SDR family NAD(P)-dependent oxidoreductase [Paenibacillus sp. Z6-24]